MNCVKVSPIAFKGAYKISGHTDVMDEILWFMRKKRKAEAPAFDFLDIRLQKSEPSVTEGLVSSLGNSNMTPTEQLKTLNGHLSDLFLIRTGEKRPFVERRGDNLDLILTGPHREIADRKIAKMVEDTLGLYRKTTKPLESLKKEIMRRIAEAINGIYQAKPIPDLNPLAVQAQLRPLDLDDLAVLPAESVFEGIRKGTFDITSGTFAIA